MTKYADDYFRYQFNRNAVRKWIRKHTYLANVRRLVRGKTLDYGCGVGELLKLLPDGSTGLEVNDVTIAYCRSIGLDVRQLEGEPSDHTFASFTGQNYKTLVISHVLEHLKAPAETLRRLLESSAAIGIERVIVVAPGVKGYASDSTHQTFLDRAFFTDKNLNGHAGYSLIHNRYFPINSFQFSKVFCHNELVAVFARATSDLPQSQAQEFKP